MTVKTQPTRRIHPLPHSLVALVGIAVANQVQARHHHAGKCKETPSECHLCKDTIAYIGALPAEHSSKVLENPQAPTFHQKFSTIMVESAKKRFMHNSFRAEADFDAAASLMAFHRKHYPREYPNRKTA